MNELTVGQMITTIGTKSAELGWGYVLRSRGKQVDVEFRPTIFDKPPYSVRVETLGQPEIQIIKTPLQRLLDGEFEDTWRFELKQRAAHLIICNRFGQLSNSLTDLMPHQIMVAHSVISSSKRRFLVADEVGLGKTIEAGLVIQVMLQQGLAKRVLIVPPGGLTIQWQEEMKEKFGLDFPIYGDEVKGIRAFNTHDLLIASLDTIKLDRPRKSGRLDGHKTLILESDPWDLIVFDEAHRLSAKAGAKKRVDKTLAFKLAEELQDRCDSLLLLTGTPHQGDQVKFELLMELVDENVSFVQKPKNPEKAVPYTQLVLRNQKSKVTDADGNPIFKDIVIKPVWVELKESGEKAFHEALKNYLRQGYGYADLDPNDKHRRAIGFVMVIFQKMAASSTAAIKQALTKRADKILSKKKKPVENPVLIGDERFAGEIEENSRDFYTDEFALIELELILELLEMEVPEDGKIEELFNVIDAVSKDDPAKKVLIFTEYRGTQDFLVEQLAARYGADCTTIIRGGMPLGEKIRSQKEFREDEDKRFLVSTEAGGEGINLQFAHILINYDMPWNPFRLAQRYGRLYRFGQKEVVQVFNFGYKDSVESLIREYLERKTRTAAETLTKITGEKVEDIEQSLLGIYEEHLDYEKIYREAMAKKDLKPSKAMIDEAVAKGQEAYRKGYEMLKNVGQFNPDRFRQFIRSPLDLSHVEEFVLEFISRKGPRLTRPRPGLYYFITPRVIRSDKGVQKKYTEVTFNRQQAMNEPRMEFLAMGHPLTDAAIRYSGGAEMGGFAATRQIMDHRYSGIEGVHFNFMVKRTQKTGDRDDIFFDLVPIFLKWDGTVVDGAGEVALEAWKARAIPQNKLVFHADRLENLHRTASTLVREKYKGEEFWDDDIVCLNAAVTRFV